jgi:hypothetical protein
MVERARQVDEFMTRIAGICAGESNIDPAPASGRRLDAAASSFRLKSQADALHQCVLDLQALV